MCNQEGLYNIQSNKCVINFKGLEETRNVLAHVACQSLS